MRWKQAAPVFLAGMTSAAIALHALDRAATAQTGQQARHQADEIVSYALGWDLGQETLTNLESDGVAVDREAMTLGFQAALGGKDPAYDDHRMHDHLIEFNDEIFAGIHADRMQNDPVYQAQAAANGRAGQAFRDRFAGLDGVQRTSTGTLYRVERAGDGESPEMGDSIIANYRMLLLDGTEIGEGDGVVINTRTMLVSTQQLVLNMRVGDKWTIVVDPKGSAGLAGRGYGIGPNETIVAELELLGIAERAGE